MLSRKLNTVRSRFEKKERKKLSSNSSVCEGMVLEISQWRTSLWEKETALGTGRGEVLLEVQPFLVFLLRMMEKVKEKNTVPEAWLISLQITYFIFLSCVTCFISCNGKYTTHFIVSVLPGQDVFSSFDVVQSVHGFIITLTHWFCVYQCLLISF